MKKLLTIFSIILIGKFSMAQDVSVTAITAPNSGCALTATENVTIRMFNFGPTLIAGSSFNVSYTINGGAPVTELLTLGANVLTNSTFFYTFTTQANLSVPGAYTFDATCALAGDINPTNDAFTGHVVINTAASVGGTVSGGTNVCIGTNAGNLTLSGHTGNVLNWEYSTDGGGTWISISNTTTTQSYLNLTVPTRYRAQVQNGGCASAISSVAIMTIDPLSVGGSVTGAATVCSGTNSGVLTSTGRTGTILKWQYSLDAGVTWIDTAHVATTMNYLNLTATRRYRVQVQSGACNPVFSGVAIITVNPPSVGGTVSGGATVCSGTNSGNLTLAGNTGNVTRWEFSTDAGATWTNIANTTTTQSYTNLTQTRYFRAFVTSLGCAGAYSSIDSIVVTSATVAGSVTANTTVCSGANSGTLTLSGHTGTINNWAFSTNGGITFTNIANTTTTQTYLNLTTTTIYRANVQNGGCVAANSASATITVNPVSVGGATSPNTTVCSGANAGTITLSGQTGTVQNWESSTDGIVWNPIFNSTTSQSYTNLVATTYYRANVKSGVCDSALSSIDTITVDIPTVGGAVSASANVCFGNNSGTLTLSGETGTILRWEQSIDGGINWTPIANTTNTQLYANITLTTQYRAVVQNGVCSTVNSTAATLTVDPVSAGGILNGSATACGGTNSGTLTLISYIGTIQDWISSTDGGVTWTSLGNTSATFNYSNVLTTTQFAVIVSSGVCSNDTSSIATITVDPPSDGGTLTMSDVVCASSNFGTLNVTGFTGTIQNWESSTDGGITWLTVANTTASQNYLNLTTTTSYRVNVKSGVCNAATSNVITITVDPIAIGGTLNGTTTVCDTINTGTLTLTGSVGTVVNWESSTDAGVTWNTIVNTTTTHTYTNLTDTTWFRVIVSSGLCGNDTSSTATIYVNPQTVGGIVTLDSTVCASSNGATLFLTGHVGTVQGWEMSTNGGTTWIPLSNTTDSLVYLNLNQTTKYRALVKSGICNAVYSSPATITVNPVSVAGTISGAVAGCEGSNGGTLTLNGYTGLIQNWLASTDNGITWNTISNTTNTESYSNLNDTTWYQAVVQSGVCPADTSNATQVTVYPKPVASFTVDTVCAGNATTFINTSSISGGFIQFNQWDLGDLSSSLTVSPVHTYAAGTYTATLITTSNFTCSDTATATILVNALPSNIVTASGPLQFCQGDSVLLSAITGGFNYLWNTAATTQTITVSTTGNFDVTITDTLTGCSNASDLVSTTMFPASIVFAGNDTSISLGSSYTLNAVGIGIISWAWFPNTGLNNATISNPMASPTETSTYQVIGTDINGCSDFDSITITVIADFNVTVSNLMTPNGDGYNDRWIIGNLENYPDTEVMVINREGQVMYQNANYDNNWDGTNKNGKKLSDGTYYYIIKFKDSDKLYKGSITVIRDTDRR